MRLTPIGWILVLLGLYALSKSRTGYHVLYYALVLILLFLVVTHYRQLEGLMFQQGGTGA